MKVTFREFGDVIRKYHDNDSINKELRFGQYFCNTFNITNPALFYEQDYEKAIGIIMDDYLDLEIDYSTPQATDYEQDVQEGQV